jgi:hypothetical protein
MEHLKQLNPERFVLNERRAEQMIKRIDIRLKWREQHKQIIYQPIPAPYNPQPVSREN